MIVYETIGATYARTRRADPRIAHQITAALGDARSVINVGAGTGSYEPATTALAVEPSAVMIAQRPPGLAPAVMAFAESMPIADDAADAAMALLTVHHWRDIAAGIAELRRIARRRVIVLTWDQRIFRRFWLINDYLPGAAAIDDVRAPAVDRLAEMLGGAQVERVLVPHDCVDGFGAAYWRRPEAYLDPVVRAGMSLIAQTDDDLIRPGIGRLADDLASGRWRERHTDLLGQSEYDAGYRLVIAEI
jgi:SAM-dependent methyltransferase